jgi:hypothetical protein
MRRPSLLVAAILLTISPTSEGIGSLLRPGMQLIYSSNDQDQAPWYIDSVSTYYGDRAGSECTRIHQRRQPDQTRSEETILCLSHDTLFSWNKERGLTPQRPVGAGMIMNLVRANGTRVRYEIGGSGQEIIPGLGVEPVLVLQTTVTTSDSAGGTIRRLRELYAPGLATATSGEFEVPDSTEEDGWRSEQRFKLREIRLP